LKEGIYLNQIYCKMDVSLTSVIISIIASLFFIIPIAIDQWNKKKKDKEQ
jgi:hypothetical protein